MSSIKKIEKILKAIADKNRLKILHLLLKKSLCVCEITSIMPLSQSTISGHLKVLRDADIVEVEKNGLFVEYYINKDNFFLNKILNHLKEEFEKDEILQIEYEKLLKADRHELCKK